MSPSKVSPDAIVTVKLVEAAPVVPVVGPLIDQIVQEFLDYYVKGKTTVITPQLTSEHDRTIPVNK